MKPGRTLSFALVAMSLLFFCMALASPIDSVMRGLGAPPGVSGPLSSVIWNYSLFGLISLCGGMVFLAGTRQENPSWCLGIPLVIAYAMIAVPPVYEGYFVISHLNPPRYDLGIVLSLVAAYGVELLLPPCAALFFWSQRRQGWWAPVMAGIALLFTLNSLVFMYFVFSPLLVTAGLLPPAQPQYIDGHPVKTDGEGLIFLLIQYMVGLPVIGICLLLLAGHSWYAIRKEKPLPTVPPEVRS